MAKFDIRLTKEAARLVDALARLGKIDMRPTLNVIGTGYLKEVKSIFDKQQPRGKGDRWAPLSVQYAKWKQKHFPDQPILVRTGALKDSMTMKGALGNIFLIGKTSGTFGTSIPYGIFHDSDFPRRAKLPRRDFSEPIQRKLPRRNFSDPSDRRINIWKQQIVKDLIHNFTREGVKVEGDILEK